MVEHQPFISRGSITAFLKREIIEVQHYSTVRRYELLPEEVCFTCSAPLTPASMTHRDPSRCWTCNVYDDLYGFKQAFAMARYVKDRREDLEKDIRQKYYGNDNGSKRLGVALALFVREYLSDFLEPGVIDTGVVVPAPIHPKERMKRGFNQMEVMAEEVGGFLGIVVEPSVLEKVKEGSQMRLSTREGRKENVKGAFRCNPIDDPPDWAILLDDLLVTGFTAAECSLQLKEAGIKTVYVLTAGRNVAPEGGDEDGRP